MYGAINSCLEIVLDIDLSAQGVSVNVPAIVDTGLSDFLTLPQALIDELALQINWHGTRRKVSAQATDGGILLGMAMLEGSLVTLEAAVGGSVTIEELE